MDNRPLRRAFKAYLHEAANSISERHASESAEADRVFDEIARLRRDVDRALEEAAAARRETESLGDKLDFVKLCLDEVLVNGVEPGS